MFYSLPHKYPLKQNRLLIAVCVTVATLWLLLPENFETIGSKFSHETEGLLASYTAIKEV